MSRVPGSSMKGVEDNGNGKATGPSYVWDAQMRFLHKVHAVAIMGMVNRIGNGGKKTNHCTLA